MKSKKITKSILPIVMTSGLVITGGEVLFNNDVAIASEVRESDGFVIGKPYVESGSVKFSVTFPTGKQLYKDYWSKVDRVLVDGRDFGFNNQGTSSREHYSVYNGEVTANANGLFEHYNKNAKHKIEFIFNDGSKSEYVDEGYQASNKQSELNTNNNSKKPSLDKDVIKEVEKNSYSELALILADDIKAKDLYNELSSIVINGKSYTVKDSFGTNWRGQIHSLAIGESTAIYDSWDENKRNTVVLNYKDGTSSKEFVFGKNTVEETAPTKPETAENNANNNDKVEEVKQEEPKYKIKEAKQESNWKGEKSLTVLLTEGTKTNEFYTNIKSMILNGKEVTREALETEEVSNYLGIRYFNNGIVSLLKDIDNTLEITLKDGTKITYPENNSNTKPEDNNKVEEQPKNSTSSEETEVTPKNTETTNKPTENTTVGENKKEEKKSKKPALDADVIKSATKSSYEEVVFTLADNIKARELYSELASIVINGKSYTVNDNFNTNWKEELYSLGISPSTEIYKSWGDDKRNTVVLNYKDGTSSKEFSFGEDKQEVITYKTSDKLEDGEYTLGFNALYADGRAGTSMLEGFFDKNIKLEVKNGEMKISMLNLLFAYSLYDFAIENDSVMSSTKKEYFGNKNSAGQYDKAIFTSKITKLEDIHLAGVIVGHMGGLHSQIGDFDKYTKVKLKFKPEVVKGWTGYDFVNTETKEREASDELLNKKLIANGVDTNKDGKVTAEELQNFEGSINLGALEIDGAIDKGKIYNIDLLKNMGPKVKSFSTSSNELGELPEDLFKNATGLEYISLGGNKITKLPAGLFANNTNLKRLNLSANNLVTLPENLLANNQKLEELSIDNAWLNEIPENLFKNLTNLKQLSLSSNKLSKLANNTFLNNKNLEFLSLEDNNLTSLPQSLTNLVNLRGIGLTNNNVTSLPNGLESLTKLDKIYANNNHLSAIADGVWANLAKNNGRVYAVNNALSNIPLEIIKQNGKLSILDIANNYLPKDITYVDKDVALLGLRPETTQSYYPQKTASVLNVVAKDNKVVVSPEKTTILNLFHWYHGRSTYYGGEGILQGISKYTEFINKLNKPLSDMLKSDDYSRNWQINTKVEIIRGDNKVEIYNNTTSNEDDKSNEINYKLKKGDKVKVTKTLFELTATNDTKKIIELEKVVDAQVTEENTASEIGTVKVRLKQAFNDFDSMGNGALSNIAELEKDGEDTYGTITFSPLFIKAFNATGNVTKIGVYPTLEDMKNNTNLKMAEVVESYENGNPKKVRLKVKDGEKYVGVRVWVDMMDEIARNNGQEDGSQPAVVEFYWDSKKLKEKEQKLIPNSAPTKEELPQAKIETKKPEQNLVMEEKPSFEMRESKPTVSITKEELPQAKIEKETKKPEQNLVMEEKPSFEMRESKPDYNIVLEELTGDLEKKSTSPQIIQEENNTNQTQKTKSQSTKQKILAKTGLQTTSYVAIGLSLLGLVTILRRKNK